MTTRQAVLFDLDGTFADTAADLAAACNRLLAEQGHKPMPVERLRPFTSSGARGMVLAAFGIKPGEPEYSSLREAFLEYYGERTCVETRLFPGIAELLAELKKHSIRWGLATNKSTRFTEKIVTALGVQPDCVVCGDSTEHLKPHPAMLHLAAERLEIPRERIVYLGDDLRDMQAAHAAGMRAVAVEWGYHHPDQGGPGSWQADAIIRHPLELLPLLEAA